MGKTRDLFKKIRDTQGTFREKAMAPHSSTLTWKIPWTEVRDIVQETGIKTILMEKKCKKAQWLSEEALQPTMKTRKAKGKGEKERYSHLIVQFQRIARRDKKALSLPH